MPLPPLDRSTIWPYEDGQPGRFYYQRNGNPVVAAAEAALGALEGGHAVLFPSGAGATTGLVLATLEPGATIALARDAYYGTGVTFRALERWGLRHVEYDQTGAPPAEADLVWVEAPSNPLLSMPDLALAAAHPAPLVVDATAATPVNLRPLEHGADHVLHSATKFLAGHHDVLLGAVVVPHGRGRGADRRVPQRHRQRPRARPGLAAAPQPRDARGAHGAAYGVGDASSRGGWTRTRASSASATPGSAGCSRSTSRGGHEAALRVETGTRGDRERDEPRRHDARRSRRGRAGRATASRLT